MNPSADSILVSCRLFIETLLPRYRPGIGRISGSARLRRPRYQWMRGDRQASAELCGQTRRGPGGEGGRGIDQPVFGREVPGCRGGGSMPFDRAPDHALDGPGDVRRFVAGVVGIPPGAAEHADDLPGAGAGARPAVEPQEPGELTGQVAGLDEVAHGFELVHRGEAAPVGGDRRERDGLTGHRRHEDGPTPGIAQRLEPHLRVVDGEAGDPCAVVAAAPDALGLVDGPGLIDVEEREVYAVSY